MLIEDKFDIEKYAYDNVIKNGIICDKISANFIKNGEVNRKFQKILRFHFELNSVCVSIILLIYFFILCFLITRSFYEKNY